MDAKVGIIGAGPAGISTGVQLQRYGISHIILEQEKIGGLVANAYLLENTILYPHGLRGSNFVKILEEYARKYALSIIFERVLEVKKKENFEVMTQNNVYTFRYLVVATGTRPKRLSYFGVNYHVTELKKSNYGKVLIIGGGDIALDYALSMSEKASRVYVLHRSELKAIPSLQNHVKKRKNIKLVSGEPKNILPITGGKRVVTSAGVFEVDEVLVAIGRVPNLEIVENIRDPRLFIIGDARNGIYRQTSLAIGNGIKTAMRIWRWEKYGNPE